MNHTDEINRHGKIVFFIERQKFEVDFHEISARQLLTDYANEDAAETTLVLKCGNELKKFDDDDVVTLKNGLHFVVFHDGPTTVSYFGPLRMLEDIVELGFKAALVKGKDNNDYVVIDDYEIALGKFAGSTITLGLLATPNFPESVGSSIHVKITPQLYEKTDSAPNLRNIIDSGLGTEWRYWSRNFNWGNQRKTATRLMSQISGVFLNA
jgi:hypothetical protein